MQTLSWQKLRFLKFINSFFNPFWRKGEGERLKERKDVKKVLSINKVLFRPFSWKERPLLLYYFSSFTAYLFTPSPLTPFSFLTSSFLLSTSLLTTYSFPPYYFLLPSILLTSYYFSPYYSPLFSLLLPSLLLTPYYFSPYYFSPSSLLPLSLLLLTFLLTPSPSFLQTYPPAIAAVGRWLAVRCPAQWHRRPCVTDSLRGDYPYNRALERCEEFHRS